MPSTEQDEIRARAQVGFENIRTAIIALLKNNPQGLGNAEVAEELGLRTGMDGRQKDYLTWSILQGLVQQRILSRVPRPNNKRQLIYQLTPPSSIHAF